MSADRFLESVILPDRVTRFNLTLRIGAAGESQWVPKPSRAGGFHARRAARRRTQWPKSRNALCIRVATADRALTAGDALRLL